MPRTWASIFACMVGMTITGCSRSRPRVRGGRSRDVSATTMAQ
ncbi:Uncharacterised protein [Bordetella pertussis]|nr:Uncharacterised protein [Bordetella pertussis]